MLLELAWRSLWNRRGSVLLTLLSFLLCVLVVGIAGFLVSMGNSSRPTIALAAIIMGAEVMLPWPISARA